MTRPFSLFPLLLLLAAPGCSDDRALVVVTPWDRPSCRALDDAFHAGGQPAAPIRWIHLDPLDDPGRLLAARPEVDVLLGWPASTLESLQHRGLLAPPDAGPRPRWPREATGETSPPRRSPLMGDPRIDPLAREAIARTLNQGDWRDGYARLIAQAATPGPVDLPPTFEGASLALRADHPDAPRFLEFIAERHAAAPSPPPTFDPASLRLAAELVGATSIDASEELRSACPSVARSADAESLRATLSEPPPWPPSSIQRWRDDPDRRPLLGTLAAALVEGEEARSWLLESWKRPARPIDGAFLAELAAVDGGRLVDSPRVLPWLRAEWTAWARQRFAMVARDADDGEAAR